MIYRRTFVAGLLSTLAAPAIVRPTSIMPIKALLLPEEFVVTCPTQLVTLTATTRAALVPRSLIQFYLVSPTLAALLKESEPPALV